MLGLQFRQIQREDDDDSRNQQQGNSKGGPTVNIRKLIYEFKAENPLGEERIKKFIKVLRYECILLVSITYIYSIVASIYERR